MSLFLGQKPLVPNLAVISPSPLTQRKRVEVFLSPHTPPFPLKRGAGTKEKEEEVFLPIRMDSWTRLSFSLARFPPVLALNSPKNTRDTALPKHGLFLKNNIFQTFFFLMGMVFLI